MHQVTNWLMKRLHAPVYAARIRELVNQILPHVESDDRVLDVGCGSGVLGRALIDSPHCPPRATIKGLERRCRGNEAIDVVEYDGHTIPFDDDAFDLVILADVLHHEPDPNHLICECARVTSRLLIIKDHKIDGPLAWPRIAFLDWAANHPYGVECLYTYKTAAQWADCIQALGLEIDRQLHSMHLYPPLFNFVFGRRLQYMAVLRVSQPRMEHAGE